VELFLRNGDAIAAQAPEYPLGQHSISPGVHFLNQAQIFVAPSVDVHPGVVLDARSGPIVIDSDAVIMANSVIQGPTYIGPGSQVKIAAKIYHGTSVGPQCKIGGEVEESVIQGYSNKQHDGFLGHAFVGEWCNLGAGTTNSDLKNNYGSVRIWCNGEWCDTGSQFIGLLMGDHSKTGINTSLNTGTVVGVSCNIFDAGLPPKFVPSFSWGRSGLLATYGLPQAIETARRVTARRSIWFGEDEERLLQSVFQSTMSERASF